MMITPGTATTIDIWFPRYSSQYTGFGEKVVLLACYKVDQGGPVIIVNFTKAKHLHGQRYAIYRHQAQQWPVDTNGKIACYSVPMSAFEEWNSPQEVKEIALSVFKD
jgi:hypothetical protein